jgi:hypothetical protein
VRYLYIAGKWTEAADDGTSQTINPYDASVLDTLAEAAPPTWTPRSWPPGRPSTGRGAAPR